MFKYADYVRVTRDFEKEGVRKGDAGTIVHVYETSDRPAYEVEFSDKDGETTAMITAYSEDIELIEWKKQS